MNFDYDEMPRRNKEHSNGKIMRLEYEIRQLKEK